MAQFRKEGTPITKKLYVLGTTSQLPKAIEWDAELKITYLAIAPKM